MPKTLSFTVFSIRKFVAQLFVFKLLFVLVKVKNDPFGVPFEISFPNVVHMERRNEMPINGTFELSS